MILRFVVFALTLLLLTPGSVLSEEAARPSKPRAAKRAVDPQQQAMERARRCQDAVSDAQNTAVGTSVLSSAVGFLPFGSAAASAAANIGTGAASEIARQKAAAAVQGNCGG
ncbi:MULTISPECIES: hypothetical protein [unclassified Afipia]|uniref:hypothetical protein n=1 Tax=unclassified Afipia TaxID=2642050 RepID=UPI000413FE88|nr:MULTISPECIES: hypothetical protein [unclassified Afipia]